MRRLVVADLVRLAEGPAGDALLLRDDRVERVGRAEELRRPDLVEERYPGAVIVPGLRDAHFHPVSYAASLHRLSLREAGSLAEVEALLGEWAARLPPGEALVASGLDDETLAEGRLPDRHDLDRAVPDRPVLVFRYCGHLGTANTPALELAGVGPDTPDPPGGMFDRDPEGRPSGILRETALEQVSRVVQAAAPVRGEQLLAALRGLASLGLTGLGAIVSMGRGPWCGQEDELEVLAEVAARSPLKLSLLQVAGAPVDLEQAAARVEGLGRRARFLGLKAFSDGSLGGHTAALSSPYHDQAETSGMLRIDPSLPDTARACLELGGKVAVHAIGDLANRQVLDLFEELLEDGARPEDLRIEHASVLGDEEVDRLARSGVIASVQPAFLPSETGWLERRLGPERLRLAYRFRTLAEAGVPLAGGSDCPVERPSPLWGMAAARDRAGIVPEEGLTAEQALALFTDGAARALGEPPPLRPGSPADFTVLDVDPVSADPDRLRAAGVLATWVDGLPVALSGDEPVWR